jgi:hypothetical protein
MSGAVRTPPSLAERSEEDKRRRLASRAEARRELKYRGGQGYTKVHRGTQGLGYTGVHRDTQGYTAVHRGTHEYCTQGYSTQGAGVHRGTQGYTGRRGTHGYTWVHRDTQGYTGVHRGT